MTQEVAGMVDEVIEFSIKKQIGIFKRNHFPHNPQRKKSPRKYQRNYPELDRIQKIKTEHIGWTDKDSAKRKQIEKYIDERWEQYSIEYKEASRLANDIEENLLGLVMVKKTIFRHQT